MDVKYTFWKLLSENTIVIPVIQRDYAQGRKNAFAIRENFLKSIEEALVECKPLDLNFVYGSIDEKNQFIPIDGQQRLTTLFLLHLYLIHMTGSSPASYKELKNFTYKTRMSSSYFCNQITEKKIETSDGTALKDIDDLRSAIVDSSWFGISWQNDPTVDAMLNMIDSIHKIFGKRTDLDTLLNRLLDEKVCPLYFYYLNLGEYSIEDSVYIKMNARGKALTDYENFKAKLEKFLQDKKVLNWEKYANNLDREWTDVFWNIISLEEKKKSEKTDKLGSIKFDDRMLNFIINYITNEFANYTKTTKRDELRSEIGWLISLSKVEFTNAFGSFTDKFRNHKLEDSFGEMFAVFDLMTDGKNIKVYAPDNGFYDETQIFKSIIEPGHGVNDYTPQIRSCFYAYTQYLLVNKGNITAGGLKEWFRVIKHLIEGQYFMGHDEYVHVINGIKWLSKKSKDILGFLSTWNMDDKEEAEESEGNPPYFNKYVFREECIKASLMKKSTDWDLLIRSAEANGYLTGEINVILEFAGIMDETEKIGDWSDTKSQEYYNKFKAYSEKIDSLFNSFEGQQPGLKKEYGSIFRRTLLTKGDFSMRYKQNLSMLVDRSNLRGDVTWRRLFKPQRGQEFITKRSYIKALLDDPVFDIQDVVGSCEKIIDLYTCNDLDIKYFIEIPEIMDFMIYKNKSVQCWNFFRNSYQTKFLLCSSRLSGNNYDYYKYALYCVLKREGSDKLQEMEMKSGIADVINQPIVINTADDDIYQINNIRETKQYIITGGKNNISEIKDTLSDMVEYIKNKGLLK